MGSGSSAEVDAHLRKWEAAVSDLQTLCSQHRRVLDSERGGLSPSSGNTTDTRSAGPGAEGSGGSDKGGAEQREGDRGGNGDGDSERSFRRRASSLVSFGNKQQQGSAAQQPTQTADDSPQQQQQQQHAGTTPPHHISVHHGSTSGASASVLGGMGPVISPRSTSRIVMGEASAQVSPARPTSAGSTSPSSTTVAAPKHNRQQVLELRKARLAIYESYALSEKDTADDIDHLDGALACSHFAAVALGLSSLLGGTKTDPNRRARVTVEDIFFAAQVPLHMVHATAPPLTVMTDIIREFVDVDNRFKGLYNVETVYFDITPSVGQVELGNVANDIGDRQCRVPLSEFRKGITHDVEEEADALRILNYDPFVLEQATMLETDDNNGNGNNGPSAAETAARHRFGSISQLSFIGRGALQNVAGTTRYNAVNDGAYATVVDARNSVQPMVTIAEAAVSDHIFAKVYEVPLGAMYKAMMSSTESGQRARGFIRITKRTKEERGILAVTTSASSKSGVREVPLLFSPELCSGKVLGTIVDGVSAQAVPNFIAPHICACAWAMHMICGVRPQTHGHGKGLPVTDIIRTLRLPSDVFLADSAATAPMDMEIDQVYVYFSEYLKRKLLDRNVTVGLYPVLTKISREDAVPTISVFDLESILIDVKNNNEDAEAPSHVMVIQYNANVAHNVIHIADASQWCILAGYDEDTQTARLIDANPKRFSQFWTCPLDRLHKAMTGHGYMMVSRAASAASRMDSGANSMSRSSTPTSNYQMNAAGAVGSLRHVASTVQRRMELIKQQQQQRVSLLKFEETQVRSAGSPRGRTASSAVFNATSSGAVGGHLHGFFSFPKRPFSLTTIALALSQLDVAVTLDDLVHKLPYDVNALLVKHLPLECARICIDHTAKSVGLDDVLKVSVKHFEKHSTGKLTFPVKQFADLLNQNLNHPSQQSVLVAFFDNSQLSVFGASHPFGRSAIIVEFHEDDSLVTLMDCDPNPYKRVWTATLETLHWAMQNPPGTSQRTNGLIVITKGKQLPTLPVHATPNSDGIPVPQQQQWIQRRFDLSILPVQNLFHLSPSPQIQGLSLAFAQLGFYFSPEEIFYEAYLKTVSDQRRRGSQAFAWRDVDVSLAILNKKIDTRVMALVARKFIESRRVSGISAEVFDDDNALDEEHLPATLAEASRPDADFILLLNYNTQAVHGVSNLNNSVALVQSWCAETKTVGLVDAECSLFGYRWTTSLSQLIEAGDLDNVGTSPYGFVKMGKGSSGARSSAAGAGKFNTGFATAFGDSGPSGGLNGSSTEAPQPPAHKTTQRAVFVEGDDGNSKPSEGPS